MDRQGEATESLLSRCCATIEIYISWCSSCGRQQSYGQAFLDDRPEAGSVSVATSPYQSPQQATSSGLSASERAALLPKATELHPTGSGTAREGTLLISSQVGSMKGSSLNVKSFTFFNYIGEAAGGKLPKQIASEELKHAMVLPKKEGALENLVKRQNGSGLSLAASEEGDFCSTCLEPYTKENPAIWTKCNHHFHLACIYEWMERKQTCPICEREMSFEEVIS